MPRAMGFFIGLHLQFAQNQFLHSEGMELLRQVKSLRKQKVLLHRRACVLGVDGMQAICIPNVGGTVG